MGEPIKHHYVPQFYLKRFADVKEQLRVVERKPPCRKYISNVKDVAAERLFYRLETAEGDTLQLEKTLSEIEGECRGALSELIERPFPPEAHVREVVGFFIALQWLRGRDQRDSFSFVFERLAKQVGKFIPEQEVVRPLEKKLGRPLTGEETAEAVTRISRASVEHLRPTHNDLVVNLLKMAPGLQRIACARVWQLIKFDRDCLLTSDSPVVTWVHPCNRGGSFSVGGFGMCDEIRIPLDMRTALVLAHEAPGGEVVLQGTDLHAKELNRSVAANAYLRIFHRADIDPLKDVALPPPFESRIVVDGFGGE
ncbi:DUF4238 domain-containing protein [Corallococcus exiguus]|uniref:DUF4238 domain-containing protein n=1 Tax=Corallococcus exiguus TaxID=83462 RepID=UPI0014946C8C|nr:DUF4238 domain-containing protein [Corallococcus exiguus]